MTREIQLDPSIVVSESPGAAFTLSTVDQVIDYVRRHGTGRNWQELRNAAFVAAAVPSDENLATLRRLAAREFKAFDNAPGKVNLRFREAIATFLPKKGWS